MKRIIKLSMKIKNMKKIASIFTAVGTIFLLTMAMGVQAGTMIFEYGFEDWTGDANTTPNYFSSTNYSTYWDDHTTASEVVQAGNPNCSNRNAYEGDYYYHQNWYTGGLDPCLGTTPISRNPHMNIGSNAVYPSDPKNNLVISDAVQSDTITVRFYFRTAGNWPNTTANNMKFIRIYGNEAYSQILGVTDDGEHFDISDHPSPGEENTYANYHNIFVTPNWNDGEWHSIVMVTRFIDNDNTFVRFWLDDWNMAGQPTGSASPYQPNLGIDFSHVSLFVNWGGGSTQPSSNMGIDMDNIEIWDGIPNEINCSDYNNNQATCESGGCNYCNGTCQGGACVATIRADVDQNSIINSTDALLTLRSSLGLIMSSTNWQVSSATGDVDCSFNTNFTDALLILRDSLKLDMNGTGWCVD